MVSRSPFQPLRVRDSVTTAAGASLSRSRYTNFPPFPVTPPLLLCAAPLHSQYSRQEAEQTQQAAQPQPPQPPARRGQPRACSASAAPRPASRRAQRRPLPAAQASPTRHAAELGAGPALAAVPAEGRRWEAAAAADARRNGAPCDATSGATAGIGTGTEHGTSRPGNVALSTARLGRARLGSAMLLSAT